ncbi:MAG: sigma-70 family RNA polymerase sigma factor [Planctomycetota bacterium]
MSDSEDTDRRNAETGVHAISCLVDQIPFSEYSKFFEVSYTSGVNADAQLNHSPPPTLSFCNERGMIHTSCDRLFFPLIYLRTPVAEAATTRASLLIRLRDQADAEAWSQFVDIYSPLVFGFARRWHFRETEAADLVQEVLSEVFRSIERFEYDPQLGKFRSWLYKISKRKAIKMNRKRLQQIHGTGDSVALRMLQNFPDDTNDLERDWEDEYRSHLFQWAIGEIKTQFQPKTWSAFWFTAVEGKSPTEVAETLGLSLGAVYIAKSRITKRLGDKIKEVDDSL